MVVKEALANSLKDAQDALALENSLREKYQNPGAVDKHFGYDSLSKDKERSNGLHVHLCMVCKGEGREFTLYGARVIEKTCENCEGVGTFTTKNGVKISDDEATQIRREASRDPLDKKSEEEISKLEAMVEKYQKEVTDLKAEVEGASSEEKRELLQTVLDQVVVMLERSKGALNFKRTKKGKHEKEKERLLKEKIMANLREGNRRKSEDGSPGRVPEQDRR